MKSMSLLLLICFAFLAASSLPAFALEVIAHQAQTQSTAKHLTVRELRAIYSLRLKQWPNGLPITVVALSNDSILHNDFCKKILRVFPHQLKLGWDRVTFSGLGRPPIIAKNKDEMYEIIKNTPGAIGYIDQINKNSESSVIPVLLDGK